MNLPVSIAKSVVYSSFSSASCGSGRQIASLSLDFHSGVYETVSAQTIRKLHFSSLHENFTATKSIPSREVPLITPTAKYSFFIFLFLLQRRNIKFLISKRENSFGNVDSKNSYRLIINFLLKRRLKQVLFTQHLNYICQIELLKIYAWISVFPKNS